MSCLTRLNQPETFTEHLLNNINTHTCTAKCMCAVNLVVFVLLSSFTSRTSFCLGSCRLGFITKQHIRHQPSPGSIQLTVTAVFNHFFVPF